MRNTMGLISMSDGWQWLAAGHSSGGTAPGFARAPNGRTESPLAIIDADPVAYSGVSRDHDVAVFTTRTAVSLRGGTSAPKRNEAKLRHTTTSRLQCRAEPGEAPESNLAMPADEAISGVSPGDPRRCEGEVSASATYRRPHAGECASQRLDIGGTRARASLATWSGTRPRPTAR